MIDIPLREAQFSRVLGFLNEQLADNDVTIVFGDADSAFPYLVSNRPLRGYQRHGEIYVKELEPDKWSGNEYMSMCAAVAEGPCYHSEFGFWDRELFSADRLYAWNFSQPFRHMFQPNMPYPGYDAPDDADTLHEAAHGILQPHNNFLLTSAPAIVTDAVMGHIFHTCGRINDAIDEAVAQRVAFINYIAAHHPDQRERQMALLRARAGPPDRINRKYTASAELNLQYAGQVESIRQQIKERNLTRKAAASHA